jgi:arginyl-tRNA synthetase
MVKQKIKQFLRQSVLEMGFNGDDVVLSIPQNPEFGDYSSNIALQIAKSKSIKIKQSPVEIAKELAVSIKQQVLSEGWLERIEVAGAGFINFYIKPDILAQDLAGILENGSDYGKNNLGGAKKIQVEFISANPTGPLTLANGRGGALGDALANVLIHSGYSVEREFYVNDTGNQVRLLGASIKAALGLIEPAENHYQGEYVKDLAQELVSSGSKAADLDDLELGHQAADHLMAKYIKPAIERLGIQFDEYYSERSLHQDKKLEKTLDLLKENNLSYEQDGALWFKSSQFGDEKDRVLITSESETGQKRPTYYLTDIAYHIEVYSEGFHKKINLWGADHHSYAVRFKAVMEALGYKDRLEILMMQLVKLFKEGKEVRMSKRAGNFVTLDELLDSVSKDVARFFFLMYAPNSHINFNLDLATETSQKNPVYFVQYAHARMSGILEKAGSGKVEAESELKLLVNPHETALIKHLLEFPDLVEEIAKSYQVHYLSEYAISLADLFHKFYEACPVMNAEGEGLKQARLKLVEASRVVLANVLGLMGVGAPNKM